MTVAIHKAVSYIMAFTFVEVAQKHGDYVPLVLQLVHDALRTDSIYLRGKIHGRDPCREKHSCER